LSTLCDHFQPCQVTLLKSLKEKLQSLGSESGKKDEGKSKEEGKKEAGKKAGKDDKKDDKAASRRGAKSAQRPFGNSAQMLSFDAALRGLRRLSTNARLTSVLTRSDFDVAPVLRIPPLSPT
jgi:hypothetical protein